MNPAPTDLQAALRRLPHGPEFRFVDRLTRLDPGRSGSGEYTVRATEPYLRGHFPGEPLFPGVLLVEAAAQLAGTVAQSDPAHAPLADLRLTAVRNVKIFGTACPGATIELHTHISARLGNLIQASVKVLCLDKLLLQGDLTLSGAKDLPCNQI